MATDKAIEAAARALCKAMGDDWNREGKGVLAPLYSGYVRAAVIAYLRNIAVDERMIDLGRRALKDTDKISYAFKAMCAAKADELEASNGTV